MDTRINLILNGKRNLRDVLENFRKLLESEDRVMIYTKSERKEFMDEVKGILGVDDEGIEKIASFDKFNEIDYAKVKENGAKRIIGIKMPNSLFHTISRAYNDAFRFVDKTNVARFVHAFADDCMIVDGAKYDPSIYEWFMDTFNEPFVMDSKTNPGNFAFKKYSPRFVFISQKYLKQPISFANYESREHFIIDRSKINDLFDENINRMYITEFIIRLHEKGIVRHPSFYPDPVIETWVKRDNRMPFNGDVNVLNKEYGEDENILRSKCINPLKTENSVDPIIRELSVAIKEKLEETTVGK